MILIGGENLIDFIQVGTNEANPTYQANPGGSPYNCAKAIALQRAPVGYLTPISLDAMGDLLEQGLTNAGVKLLSKRRPEPSSLAIVSLHDGVPTYQFYRQETAERMVSLNGLNESTPEDVQAFHTGSLAITQGEDAKVWTEFYTSMKTRQVFTSLDPNIRPAFILDRDTYLTRLYQLLNSTDLLKLSDEDLAWLYPGMPIETASRRLFDRSSAKLLIVTLGSNGAFALTGGKNISVCAAPVGILKDAVGAGDTFMATLLAQLHRCRQLNAKVLGEMNEIEIEELLYRAAIAAALNCEKAGSNPPTLEELNTAASSFNSEA